MGLCGRGRLPPRSNIQKMNNGIPLTDEDRAPWLLALHNPDCPLA